MKPSQTTVLSETETATPLRLTMQRGPLGFDAYRHFVLENLDDAPPFKLLLSVDDADVAFFVVASPDMPFEYQPRIPAWAFAKLELPEGASLDVLVIVSIDETGGGTANLRAPILVNTNNGAALQVVLDETMPLRRALSASGRSGP
jgi:flagellar assembly factor FliW